MTVPVPLSATFATVEAALEFRKENGGWVFAPNAEHGALGYWFGRDYTPTDIFNHPLTAGKTGRLV